MSVESLFNMMSAAVEPVGGTTRPVPVRENSKRKNRQQTAEKEQRRKRRDGQHDADDADKGASGGIDELV